MILLCLLLLQILNFQAVSVGMASSRHLLSVGSSLQDHVPDLFKPRKNEVCGLVQVSSFKFLPRLGAYICVISFAAE